MTFAYPWALLAAVGAALLVLALHFIARRRPRAVPFPTARFVPARSVRAPSRSTRPADLLLLLLRVLALLLLGAAFARPALKAERRPLARVVALDLSASGRSWSAARDSAARYLRTGDLLVVFDSAARLIPADGRDSLAALVGSHSPGSLSARLGGARRRVAIRQRGMGCRDGRGPLALARCCAAGSHRARGGFRAKRVRSADGGSEPRAGR